LNFQQNQSREYTVNFGTKVYVDRDVNLNQRYASIVQHNYLAEVENLDFNDARNSAAKINKWISETTKGNIKDLVSEDSVSNSVILMINALYFEGTWRYPFSKTLKKQFLTADNKRVEKAFMEHTGNFYYFNSKYFGAKIVRLPYRGGRYSMFIILPTEATTLDSVIDKLESNAVKNEAWHMDELEVHIQMPKFKFDSSINLNEAVKKVSGNMKLRG
jgi:serine protease inhibitor